MAFLRLELFEGLLSHEFDFGKGRALNIVDEFVGGRYHVSKVFLVGLHLVGTFYPEDLKLTFQGAYLSALSIKVVPEGNIDRLNCANLVFMRACHILQVF